MRARRRLLAALAVLLVASVVAAQPAEPVPPAPPAEGDAMIHHHVLLDETHAHRVRVRLTLAGGPGDELLLALPVWTPGSYLVREYARHVLELSARGADGRPLAAAKVDKNTWRVPAPAGERVEVEYVLYANELSVRTSQVDADHAFLSPPAVFFAVRGRTAEPQRVTVAAPDGWDVFTALPRSGDGFLARDYDHLVDSPIECGPHRVLAFEHRGVPHRVVLAGQGEVDGETLVADLTKVLAEVSAVFDRMPFDDYTFIVLLVDQGSGGLEHADSSVNMTTRWSLRSKEKYRDLLELLAHEYFHAWNVKRFRPAALGPFDYDRENYTRDLWVVEGVTSYYDSLAVLRAGCFDGVDEWLKERAGAFRKEAERPGGRRMSLSDASLDAWIKLYRPDENSGNSSVSYYTKGALVALMLDLRIRRLTAGARTLADALRLGWERYAAHDRGYPEGAFEQLAAEVAGADLTAFFADTVRGTGPLDPDPELAHVGLRLARTPGKADERRLPQDDEGFPLEPWLGATTKAAGELCRVDTVLEGGPAFEAGLNHGDLLLAVDDMRVAPDTLQDRLDRTAGRAVTLTFWRGQQLRTLAVQPELRRVEEWALAPVEGADAAQRAAFKAWTGHDHPASEPGAGDAAGAPQAPARETQAGGGRAVAPAGTRR